MIERKFIKENLKERQIKEFINNSLPDIEKGEIKLHKTPLGEKIIIETSRPGVVVGQKGQKIKKMTEVLKKKYRLENPNIEVREIQDPNLNPYVVASRIVSALQRFGISRFKSIGYKELQRILNAGAQGAEIIISGKVPSKRARKWRFYSGYIKKCGNDSIEGVRSACSKANLNPGSVGIKVKIMPPDLVLPDKISIKKENDEI